MSVAGKMGQTEGLRTVAGSGGFAGIASRLREILVYLALTIEIGVVIVDKSDLHNLYESYIFRATFVMTLLAVMLGRRTAGEWITVAVACAFGFIIYRCTGRNEILRMAVFAAACAGISRDRLLKTAFFETLAGCLALVLLSVTGIFGKAASTALYRLEDGVDTRYCLGFGHPNALHCMFYMLMLLAMVIWDRKLKLWHYLLMLALNTGLFLLTDSRTGFGIAVLTILAGAVVTLNDGAAAKRAEREGAAAEGQRSFRSRPWLYVCGGAALIFSVLFSVASAVISRPLWEQEGLELWHKIDNALNNRITELYWAHEKGDITHWTLFSSRSAERYFDMGWCRLFYWYGIIPAIVMILMLIALVYLSYRGRDAMALIMLASLSVYTIAEAHIVSVYIGRNWLIFLLGLAAAAFFEGTGKKRYGLIPAGAKDAGGGNG